MTGKQKIRQGVRPYIGWITAVGVLVALLLAGTQTVLAHERVEVGPYVMIVGWQIEPPIVGERNALSVEITEDEEPVTGVEATLDVELVYATETFRANLNPTGTPGLYTVDIFPTVRGQYGVHLFGTLGETAVDVTVEPEEVFPGSRIQFPEPLPDSRDLQKQVTALETDLRSAQTITYVALGLAGLALLLAIATFIKKR